MSSESQTPWIQIVTAFKTIQELCRQVEAQEKRAQQVAQTPSGTASSSGLLTVPAKAPDRVDLVALRAALRSCLLSLKTNLSRTSLTEHETFHALFPLTLHTDELARSATQGRVEAWPSLQRELLECDDGGVRFYRHLDVLFTKPELPPLVFEVFYLCLNSGFVGQYRNNPEKLTEYKQKLCDHIPVVYPSDWNDPRRQAPDVELVAFPTRYYLFALGAVLGVFALLHLVSIIELNIAAWLATR